MADNTILRLKGICLRTILILSPMLNFFNINYGNASVFSYTPDMENLLSVQEQVIRSAKSHLANLDESDQRIIRGLEIIWVHFSSILLYISRWGTEHRKAMRNQTHYLENPINAYGLVRRLVIDLKAIERILTWDRFKEYKRKKKLEYPTEHEKRAANIAFIHLIIVYQFNISELANGTLISNFNKENKAFVEYVTPMIAADCFELAQTALKYYEYEIALGLAEEAFHKYPQDCIYDCSFKELDIIQFLSNLYADLGELTKSLQWLEKNKTEELTQAGLIEYEWKVKLLKEKLETLKVIQKSTNEMEKRNQMMNNKPLREKWKGTSYTLCFAERISHHILSCHYRVGPAPFRRLARLKAETLHLEPEITLFHDVISDNENSAIQQMSEKGEDIVFNFENVLDPDNMLLRHSNCQGTMHVYQLMRQAACYGEFNAWPLAALHRRSTDMSGFDPALLTPTLMYVTNYGVAGYHNPHCDSESDMEIPTVGTILYYLNEVDQGGATVFTELNLTIFPKKNSAIYWKNLLPGGSTNRKTKHAACPVVRGSKWIITKWMSNYVKKKYFL